jgi:phosphoglycolate phosphatase
MKPKTIIFDLDGTLIDSADSILYGFELVLKEGGYVSRVPLVRDLIGPPLKLSLQKLSGINDGDKLDAMVSKFKSYYDSVGYKNSFPYKGVEKLLKDLSKLDHNLIIATNKRIAPTRKILDHFGWSPLFSEIYAIDGDISGPFENKAEMLSRLILNLKLDNRTSLYIGDRIDDQYAAHASGLSSITVEWGYGDYGDLNIYAKTVSSVEQLGTILKSS